MRGMLLQQTEERRGMIEQLKREMRSASPAAVYAALMLGVFPLYYQNHYFNINTCKYRLFLWLTLFLCVGVAVCAVVRLVRRERLFAGVGLPVWAMLAFVCCAAVSCAFSEEPAKAFSGELGRRSGLLYLLAVGAMTFCLSQGGGGYRICLWLFLVSGSAACALGVLNYYYVDPLRFYTQLTGGQENVFISTIGHINFFGAFVAMVLSFALAGAISARRRTERVVCQALAFVGFSAALAARSDSVYIAIAALALALLRPALASWRALARALLCAASFFLSAWLMGILPFEHMELLGISAVLSALGSGLAGLGGVCAALGVLFFALDAKGMDARALPYVRRALYALCAISLLSVLLCVVWFTAFDRKTPLGSLENYLRLNEAWGTGRGFAWIHALGAYAEFSPLHKLFGCGPDLVRRVLAPLMTEQALANSGGVFENCHNEYLQYLLTTGALGLGCYLTFLSATFYRLARAGRQSPAVRAVFAAVFGYAAQAFVSVNQPITTTIFFVLCAVGLGLTADIARRQDAPDCL